LPPFGPRTVHLLIRDPNRTRLLAESEGAEEAESPSRSYSTFKMAEGFTDLELYRAKEQGKVKSKAVVMK
jgi:hypothetical protein